MAEKFPLDFFGGTHPSIGLVPATYLAQRIAKDYKLSEPIINQYQIRVLDSVQAWLKLNYPSKYESRSGWHIGFASDPYFWGQIINGAEDVVDALMLLRHFSESNWQAMVDDIGESRVYLALLFLALSHAAKIAGEDKHILYLRYSNMAHKCVTELVLLDDGPFVGASYHEEEKRLLLSAAFDLSEETRTKDKVERQKRAAKIKAVKVNKVKEFAIELYNRGNYGSKKTCAEINADKVREFHDRNYPKLLTTRDFVRRVRDWLYEADKEGKLDY